MAWTTIEFEVLTPMFVGNADQRAEFRVPSLRGAMRYWFRALAGPCVGDDVSRLARVERLVFGSGDEGSSSPVLLRCDRAPDARAEKNPPWVDQRVGYMLGPGLHRAGREGGLTRSFLAPGSKGTIGLRLTRAEGGKQEDLRTVVTCTLWALSVYGGLGARARRGFGGIAFTGLDGLCPRLPAADPLALQVLRDIFAEALARLAPGEMAVPPEEGYPSFPSFSCWWTPESSEDLSAGLYPTWNSALQAASGNLRAYRAPIDAGRFGHTVEYDHWVRGCHLNPAPTGFTLAAFGLPILFKGGAKVGLAKASADRRASPLWIRTLPEGDKWRLLYHLSKAELFPPGATLALDRTPLPPLSERTAYDYLFEWTLQAP